MIAQDFLLLSPILALLLTVILVVLTDIVVEDKRVIAALSVVGIAASGVATAVVIGLGLQGTAFAGAVSLDAFSAFFFILFQVIGILIVIGSADWVATQFKEHEGEFYALLLASLSGMMLMAASRELIAIFVAIELTSISLYALAAFNRDSRGAEAGLKYLLLGAVSSAVMLYGMALVYGITGSTYLLEIATRSPLVTEPNYAVMLLGIVFMIAGFGFKIAAFPFQMWVPDVYEGAPTPVTAFLSVASKAAGFAIILRVFYEAFGNQSQDWTLLWAIIAAFSMFLGNLVAIAQSNIKRMLGYSSIAQAGYLLIGVASLNILGPTGVLFYLFTYSLTNIVAFVAIMAISQKIGSDQIDDYRGMRWRSPWMAFALGFAMVSLTGIPPAAGFFAKIYVFQAAIEANLTWLVLIGVLNSVISAYYYLRIVKVMYVDAAPEDAVRVTPTVGQFAIVGIGSLGVLALFLVPAFLYNAATVGAATFFG